MSSDDPGPIDAGNDLGMMEGLLTTRAIRRYTSDPVPPGILRDILFAATRAPSGSNRQPFRFLVLADGDNSRAAKRLVAEGARQLWSGKRLAEGYDTGSGADVGSPKARVARAMQHYVDNFETVPVMILACLRRYREPTPTEGASVYPACQNILLAARALGYGGVLTGFHLFVEPRLRELLSIPDDAFIAATITLGKPMGRHGPVRRVPMREVVYADQWGTSPAWAVDPPGTLFTSRL